MISIQWRIGAFDKSAKGLEEVVMRSGVRALVMTAALVSVPLFGAPAFAAPVGTGAVDVDAIAAKIDPGVVDINTTLANGAAAGTGMVITSSGEVLTNNHVINGATSISVQIAGSGPSYDASVLGYDAPDDVALLQIQGVSGLATVSTGDPSQLAVNDPVVALGNALGRGGTPATAAGSVTALNQSITATDEDGSNPETLSGMIQVDAQIQPGDSGGPLADANGDVVGMDSAGSSSSQFGQDSSVVGFAIPIDHALAIAHQIENGESSANVHIGIRAILGVQIQDPSAQSSNDPFGGQGGFGSGSSVEPTANGLQIVGVESGGPAESAGLQAGDTITSLDGNPISAVSDVSAALGSHNPGDTVQIGWVDSSGQQQTAIVALAAGPPA